MAQLGKPIAPTLLHKTEIVGVIDHATRISMRVIDSNILTVNFRHVAVELKWLCKPAWSISFADQTTCFADGEKPLPAALNQNKTRFAW